MSCLVAAGPVGRTAEAGASASVKSVAAIYSYSKSKGLFAGNERYFAKAQWRQTAKDHYADGKIGRETANARRRGTHT